MTEIPPDAGPVDRLVVGSRVREWEVVRFVARGAFGQVFEARRDTWVGDQPNRAIKVFDPILSSAARSSLLDEFGVLRSVRHPHLVAGEDAFDLVDGPLAGCVVFVMELASADLASLSARHSALPATEVASIGAQLASGLAALHGVDRLHGDVKPENVLLVDGKWKLGDFGVVSTLQGSYASPVGATLDFRPPELSQPGGAVRVHRSADVWALGVTLWLAAGGEHPFVGSDPQLRYAAVLRGDRRPAPEIDSQLAELLETRCLVADPRQRASAAELATELAAIAGEIADLTPAEVTPSPARRERGPEHDASGSPTAEPSVTSAIGETPTGSLDDWPENEVGGTPTRSLDQSPTTVLGSATERHPVAGAVSQGEPASADTTSQLRPGWMVAVAAILTTAVIVQAASWGAAALPGELAVRRAAYLLLLGAAGAAAWAVSRRQGWIRGDERSWALVGAGVTALVATAFLFGVGT